MNWGISSENMITLLDSAFQESLERVASNRQIYDHLKAQISNLEATRNRLHGELALLTQQNHEMKYTGDQKISRFVKIFVTIYNYIIFKRKCYFRIKKTLPCLKSFSMYCLELFSNSCPCIFLGISDCFAFGWWQQGKVWDAEGGESLQHYHSMITWILIVMFLFTMFYEEGKNVWRSCTISNMTNSKNKSAMQESWR